MAPLCRAFLTRRLSGGPKLLLLHQDHAFTTSFGPAKGAPGAQCGRHIGEARLPPQRWPLTHRGTLANKWRCFPLPREGGGAGGVAAVGWGGTTWGLRSQGSSQPKLCGCLAEHLCLSLSFLICKMARHMSYCKESLRSRKMTGTGRDAG